jgi:hypothetical protein
MWVAFLGSSEMPMRGAAFRNVDNYNESAGRLRIMNLTEYLESIQEKRSPKALSLSAGVYVQRGIDAL